MKVCTLCKSEKPTSSFNRNRTNRDGLQSRCKDCQLQTNREWARRHPEVRRATLQRQYERAVAANGYPKHKKVPDERRWVYWTLNNAIRKGTVRRPTACPSCGSDKFKVHAHHEDYARPLDVQWLCAPCHGELHRDRRSA